MVYKGPSRESTSPEATIKGAEVAPSGEGGGGVGQKVREREDVVVVAGGKDVTLLGNEKHMKIGKQRGKQH